MSRSTVQGLQSALRLYESDKVRDRAEGHNRIRDIFSNRENLLAFQETASRDGGAGWVAFFQCLFQVVVLEKKGWLKKASGGPQGESTASISMSTLMEQPRSVWLTLYRSSGGWLKNASTLLDANLYKRLPHT